jgi:hypothetical protein
VQELPQPAAEPKGAADTNPPVVESTSFDEDAQYGVDDFEGDESGDGSLYGTKVWMPGDAKEEKFEEEEEDEEETARGGKNGYKGNEGQQESEAPADNSQPVVTPSPEARADAIPSPTE